MPKKSSFFEPPTVIPLHTLKPREEYDGDTLIPKDYLDEQPKLDIIDADRVIRELEAYFIECAIRMKPAQEAKLASFKSGTSSSTNYPPHPKPSSSVLDILTAHMHGKVPSTETKLEIASETVSINTILENQ